MICLTSKHFPIYIYETVFLLITALVRALEYQMCGIVSQYRSDFLNVFHCENEAMITKQINEILK